MEIWSFSSRGMKITLSDNYLNISHSILAYMINKVDEKLVMSADLLYSMIHEIENAYTLGHPHHYWRIVG